MSLLFWKVLGTFEKKWVGGDLRLNSKSKVEVKSLAEAVKE